ncbi:Mobile element protein [Candidatus Enterovibrio escicola]|uniref:Mobile element protein n=1 Tax=Candidatus Enterovibrio escicola TaxID=1927127 RepID=A0A2A5T7G8_9GAMM|nr:Mobile element protein [Candidatus Enterovibrio escacola]
MAETAMFRYKQSLSSKCTLRNYNSQVGEALANVKAMNKGYKTRYACPPAEKLRL